MIRSIKRAALLALGWAVAWAPIALLVGITIVDPDNSMDEMWPLVGAYPGFLCGLLFSILLAVAERGKHLGQVPVPRAALWGVLSGVLVGAIPSIIAEPRGLLSAGIIGSITLMSALSAVVAVMIARKTKAPSFSV